MKYNGTFKDVNNKQYWVEIITSKDANTSKEVCLGTPPFTITYEGGDDTIYKPIKYSSATCTVATEEILSDIYTGENQGTSIKLVDDSHTLFTGYITPNVYNQPYNGVIDNLELEAVDALSTLKNIDYSTIGAEKGIISFFEIICHILKKCNAYKYLYITESLEAKLGGNITGELYISENNFFDEDDAPMKCSEVLEEIMKYLNFTMVAVGMHIYIIDYDSNEVYSAYDINTGLYVTSNQHPSIKEITSDNFRGSEGDLCIDNIYNKATVVSDLYTIDDVIPDLTDEKYLDNMNGDWGNIQRSKGLSDWGVKMDRYLYYRFCKHKYCTHYSYQLNKYSDGSVGVENMYMTNDYPNYWAGIAGASMKDYLFAPIVQHYVSEYETVKYNCAEGYQIYAYPEDEINFNTDLLLVCNDFGDWYRPLSQEDWDNGTRIKLLTIKPFDKNIIVKSGGVTINMKAQFVDYPFYISNPDSKDETKESKTATNQMPFVPYVITVDNKVLVTTVENYSIKSEWVDIDSVNVEDVLSKWEFFCEYRDGLLVTEGDITHGNYRVNYLNNDLPLYVYRPVNSWDFTNGTTQIINTQAKTGMAITLPEGANLKDIEIHIYLPPNPNYKNALTGVWLKDFSVDFYQDIEDVAVKKDDEDNESNTKYENEINDNWIEELSEISFKVCTFDNKKYNYSAVYAMNSDGVLGYADTLKHKQLNQTLRMEEMLIYRIVNQYKEPRIKLELQLNNQFEMFDKCTYKQEDGKEFIINSLTIDYEADTTNITLIEKWTL